jgi:nitroreductase
MKHMNSATWTAILELAQHAPSPHNVQPWRVHILSETACTVYLDTARELPQEDTTGSFIISGLVMYLETMLLAAETYHYRLTYHLIENAPIASGLQPFAEVTLAYNAQLKPRYDREVFTQRRTSRLGQLPKPIAAKAHAIFSELTAQYGHHYNHTTDTTLVQRILDRDIAALFHDMNQASYHDEIVSWFRFSPRHSRVHRDGLDARCMNMHPLEYFLTARLPWMLTLPGLRSIFARRYRSVLGATECIGWISGKFWSPAEAVIAGKLLLHFWFELTRLGLYIHPFGNLVTNKPARAWLEQELATRDIWFVFRIGYTEEPPKSYRKPLAEMLIP